MENDEDELWTSLEKIDQLVKDSKSGESWPVTLTSLNPEPSDLGLIFHIRSAPYDGSSSWDDYITRFNLVEEINELKPHNRAIYLAASL